MKIVPARIARARIVKSRKTSMKPFHPDPPASPTSRLAVESKPITRTRYFRMRFPCLTETSVLRFVPMSGT